MCTRKSICMIQNRVLYHGQVRSGSIQFCCYRLKTILKSQDFWTFVADWILVWVTLFLMLVSCWLYFNRLETVTNNQMSEPIKNRNSQNWLFLVIQPILNANNRKLKPKKIKSVSEITFYQSCKKKQPKNCLHIFSTK